MYYILYEGLTIESNEPVYYTVYIQLIDKRLFISVNNRLRYIICTCIITLPPY